MLLHFYAAGLILLALLPAVLTIRNLPLFYRLPIVQTMGTKGSGKRGAKNIGPKVSILIPARNEEASIADCVTTALKSKWPNLEVIVLDDCSTDGTYEAVQKIAKGDQRLKVMQGRELPMGWNGKQRACWLMALDAEGDWLLFIDADVRLSEDAVARLVSHAQSAEIDLLSGFPKQITGTWSEKLLIPLMHFILLGYLPLNRMRESGGAEFSAGCGQLFLAKRSAYMTCEGHKSICNSRHDGIQLPKSFRKQRFKTDVFDATDIATCRMYHSARNVLLGLLKNATEGIGNPKTIGVFTVLLSGAAVLPVASLIAAIVLKADPVIQGELAAATVLSYVPRILAVRHFGQAWLGALLHPISVAVFLMLQWTALFMQIFGIRVAWRGRS